MMRKKTPRCAGDGDDRKSVPGGREGGRKDAGEAPCVRFFYCGTGDALETLICCSASVYASAIFFSCAMNLHMMGPMTRTRSASHSRFSSPMMRVFSSVYEARISSAPQQ